MARILLGVSGGIAAYKALEFVRLATKAGHVVRVVQTPDSQRFVGALSFSALTGSPVLTSEWERDPARGAFPDQPAPDHDPLSHLELVRNADVFLIAPATANTIAKLAHGHADNLLTSAALASTCPLVIAPAMNHHMWEHAATQANIATLRERGALIIDPGVGALGSLHEWGSGRLAEPPELLAAVEAAAPAGSRPWDGLRVLVTAGRHPRADRRGPLRREPLLGADGLCARRGGRRARRGGDGGGGERRASALAARELPRRRDRERPARRLPGAFPDCDVLLMAAAVADFTPAQPAAGKLKKDGREGLTIELEPTTDVLAALSAARRPGQVIVGFAAEHGDGALEYGRDKLRRKGLDAIVVNDVSGEGVGFDALENEVTIVTAATERHVPRATKADVARAILEVVAELRAPAAAGAP